MQNSHRAVIFCDSEPEFDYRGGMFYVTIRSGRATLEQCFQPHVFHKAMGRAQAAVDAYFDERQGNDSNVVQIGVASAG